MLHKTSVWCGISFSSVLEVDGCGQDIPGVICYLDNILVSGKDEESHLKTLKEVFKHLEKHGFRLKQEKCEFLMISQHQISKDGVQALPSKVAAIATIAHTNLQELCSFLGLLNYCIW